MSDFSTDIAVVGMSCRFPSSKNLREYWENLFSNRDLVTTFDKTSLLESGIPASDLNRPNYIKRKGVFPDPFEFDFKKYNWSKKQAETTDPQLRMLLTLSDQALKDANYDKEIDSENVGVFVSANTQKSYLMRNLYSNAEILEALGFYQLSVYNSEEFFPARISHANNFSGPSIFCHSACSSSLSTLGIAYQNLLDYSCDFAICGSINIMFPHQTGYTSQIQAVSAHQ